MTPESFIGFRSFIYAIARATESFMDSNQIFLVQDSFEKVVPIADTASAIFYKRLFSLEPELQTLFKGDMYEQGAKLMKMLSMVVNGLSNIQVLVPAIEDLGKQHVSYGVSEAMYDTVGDALLWTLEQGLAEAFTPDVKEAWEAAYGTLKSIMCEAAYSTTS
jgi:nitric oxide dioxygenase